MEHKSTIENKSSVDEESSANYDLKNSQRDSKSEAQKFPSTSGISNQNSQSNTEKENEQRAVTFEEVKNICNLNSNMRNPEQLKDLAYYFKNYPYFKKYKNENGAEALNMIYKVMKYEFQENNTNVITYGETGDKFYILLKGSVAVRIPSIVENSFNLKELLNFILTNKEWIIQNEKLQHAYEVIQDILPELVKSNYQGEMVINYSLAEHVIISKVLLPSQIEFKNFDLQFSKIPKYSSCENDKMQFSFNIMMEVGVYHSGYSFGELALINKIKRSATVRNVEDCHFCTIDKENFDVIMAKIFKKKFEK